MQADAYNDWLADYCAAAPTRLFAAGVVPQQDVERAVRVIRRARERGHVAVFLRPNPSLDGKKFNDPVYDPIWAVCQELDLPLGLHPFLAPDMPGACRALGYYRLKAEGTRLRSRRRGEPDPAHGERLLQPGDLEPVRHDGDAHAPHVRRRARALSRASR